MPLFSIIIPCYNQSDFLEESILSVLNQFFSDFEILIINDGSTDDTDKIAISYTKKDNRIKYFSKLNGGLSSARNYGITLASGKYLLFMDSDDQILKDCLSEAAKIIERDNPDIIQMGYQYLVGQSGKIIHRVKPSGNFIIPAIFKGSPGPPISFIIRSEMIKETSPFDESLKSLEDWDFWIRVAKCNPVVSYLPKVLSVYRLHELSMSRNYLVMYNSFCKVAVSAPKFDSRIEVQNSQNKDYDFDVKAVIKIALLRFVALAIMQGKVEAAIDLFRLETNKYQFIWKPGEFKEMNYYLTFRYRYEKNDLKWVFREQFPLFLQFFKKLESDTNIVKKYLANVFSYHLKVINLRNWGFIGKILNYLDYYPIIKKAKV